MKYYLIVMSNMSIYKVEKADIELKKVILVLSFQNTVE